MHIGPQAKSHFLRHFTSREGVVCRALRSLLIAARNKVDWYSVGAVVIRCVFGSFSISVYHRHGKLLCLWRLHKLRSVRTSSPQVS